MEHYIRTSVNFVDEDDRHFYVSVGRDEDEDLGTMSIFVAESYQDRHGNEKENHISKLLTLDEMEYLAKRILDAVELERRRLGAEPVPVNEPIPADMPIEPAPYEDKDYGYLRLVDALNRFNNDRKKAAEFLGISERTLYRKLAEYDLLEK